MKKNLKLLIISIAIPVLLGFLTSIITRPFIDYEQLVQPPLAPPSWLFPVMWTILYILMGISFYITLKNDHDLDIDTYKTYFLQLIINCFWTIFFFVFKWRLFSIFWLIALIYLIVKMIIKFYRINKIGGLLQIPYLLWCLFALYLNIGIYILN